MLIYIKVTFRSNLRVIPRYRKYRIKSGKYRIANRSISSFPIISRLTTKFTFISCYVYLNLIYCLEIYQKQEGNLRENNQRDKYLNNIGYKEKESFQEKEVMKFLIAIPGN